MPVNRRRIGRRGVLASLAVVAVAMALAAPASATPSNFIGQFSHQDVVASTVPGNGDINPYGVAVVPQSIGKLHANHVLVSNFNNASNLQGTGTTIVDIAPDGAQQLFATIDPNHLPGACPGGIGLTTALSILPGGWVVVGSLPTTDGSAATAKAGCLLVLDSYGHVVETWSGGPINGPWDMTAVPTRFGAVLFVTNVLNGTVAAGGATVNQGTVVRIVVVIPPRRRPLRVRTDVIASGFAEHSDPDALVVGPTGLAIGRHGDLYVADAVNNRLAEIDDPFFRFFPDHHAGETVSSGGSFNAPLGLTIAPNGDILTVNGGDGNLVETTPFGHQFTPRLLDSSGSPPGSGALFGLAVAPHGNGLYFVDDVTNTLDLLH